MIKGSRRSKEVVRQKFNKGLSTYKNFFNLEEGQSPACINVQFNNDISISKRLGSSTMNTIALESTAGYGMFEFGVLNPVGGLDVNTKLLLHCNGTDGSTTFTDSETTPKTVTAQGSAQIDTAQSKFGGASGLFTTQNTNTELDYMEYSSDALAQAAYVTNAGVLPAAAYATGSNNLVSHFDGADAATAYSDPVKGAYTFVGTAQLDTAQYKWSTASLLLDGNSDYVTTPSSTDWDFGAGDFTIDMWVRFNSTTGSQVLIFREDGASYANYYQLYKPDGTTQLNFICAVGGVTKVNVNTPTGLFTTGVWYHIALVRNTITMYIFVDGVSQSLTVTTAVSTNDLTGAAGTLVVGADNSSNVGYFNGNIDEVRILKGTAVWTANFNDVLQSYSEATIKTQGSYSLKGVAAITDSSGKTLTRTLATAKDLTGISTVYFDIYSARTGDMVRIGIKDTGGTVTYKVATVYSNNLFETKIIDLSGVANADKDSIYQLIAQVMDAASANTFYVDNFYYQAPSQGFLIVGSSSDFPHSKKDFTIDEWLMFKSTTASQTIIGQGVSANDNWVVRWNSAAAGTSNCLTFQSYSGGTLVVNVSGPWAANTSTFYHLEVARQNTSNFYIFVGGSNIASTGTMDGYISGSAGLLKIGVNVVTTNNTYYEGWMDEIRVSNIVRHTGDFSPPTSEYYSATLQQRKLLVAAGTGIYNSGDLGKYWAIVQTNRTATTNYFSLIKDYVVNTNEAYDIPQYWAGSDNVYFANISTATPAAKHSLSHQGFAIFLNESSHKTSMYYVDQNEMFTSAYSNFALPTDRNDELTGGFSLGRNLYVSSKYKIFRLNYIGGSPDWEYIEVRGFGFVPKTIKKISLPNAGEAVIGLDWTKKLRVFLGSEDEIISDSIQEDNGITPFYLNNINSIDMNKCWAENDKGKGIYRLFLVYDGSSTVSHCVNFNYRTGTIYPDNGRPFNSGVLAADTADNLYMLGCNYNGRIHCMDSGNTDAGTPVDDYYVSPYFYNQSPSRVHKGQQIDLFFTESSSGTLCYQERNDFKNNWSECHDIPLTKAGSSQQIRNTIDIPETQNVYQFRLSSSSNTAEPWQLNLIDFTNSDIGVGND